MITQLWPILLGAVLALGSGYVGARWQARFAAEQQRRLLRYEARIALYVDLYTDCQNRKRHIGDSPNPYPPSVPLRARVDLLASPAVRQAWTTMEVSEFGAPVSSKILPPGAAVRREFPPPKPTRLSLVMSVEAAIRKDLAQ